VISFKHGAEKKEQKKKKKIWEDGEKFSINDKKKGSM
jgi:cytochrome c556